MYFHTLLVVYKTSRELQTVKINKVRSRISGMKYLLSLFLVLFIVACAPIGDRSEPTTPPPAQTPETPETPPEELPGTPPPQEEPEQPSEQPPEDPPEQQLGLTYTFTQDTTTTVTFEQNSGLGALVMTTSSEGAGDQQAQRFTEELGMLTRFLGVESEQEITYFQEGDSAYIRRQAASWRPAEYDRNLLAHIGERTTGTTFSDQELLDFIYTREARQILGLSNMDQVSVQSQDVTIAREQGNVAEVRITAVVVYEDEVDTLRMEIVHETTFSGHGTTPSPQRPSGIA